MPEPVARQLLPVLIGTAGHVDHGKTALVELLTGCRTDRLREEQERGLTIDLGFATCALSGHRQVGIVDVPGHEDFIRNMVAGASAVDILLLVVAADDGVMAQTIEHLRIVRHFSDGLALAAVTKTDLVDADTAALAVEETRALLSRHGYPDAPVLPVSNRTGAGLHELRLALDALVRRRQERPLDTRAFRMFVERNFALPGRGAVATGVPISGRVGPGDALRVLPHGGMAVIRSLQCFGADNEATLAGTCNALLLRDATVNDLPRGTVLADGEVYQPCTGALVLVRGLHETQHLERRSDCRVHVGTAALRAICRLLDADGLPQGVTACAHIALEEPSVLAAGDRILLRALNPPASIAAATVLAATEARAPRRKAALIERLQAAAECLAQGDRLGCALLAGEPAVRHRTEVARLTQVPSAEAAAIVAQTITEGALLDLGAHCCLHPARTGAVAERLQRALAAFHQAHPSSWGMDAHQATEACGLPTACFDALLAVLRPHGIERRHGRAALASFAPQLSQAQMALRDQVWQAIHEGGAQPPALGPLQETCACRPGDLEAAIRLLLEEGLVVRYGTNLIERSRIDQAREALIATCRQQGSCDLATFRALTGFGRNLAVAVLDRFDQDGLTRRDGNRRILRKQV